MRTYSNTAEAEEVLEKHLFSAHARGYCHTYKLFHCIMVKKHPTVQKHIFHNVVSLSVSTTSG